VVFGAQTLTHSTGQLFAFDLRWRTWARWGVVTGTNTPVIPEAMCVHEGSLYVANWYGKIHVASATSGYADGVLTGARRFVSLDVSSGWVQAGGLAGWQLVRLATMHGERKANHTLNLVVYYDFASTGSSTSAYTISSGTAEVVSIKPSPQKCQALRVRAYDADTGTPAYGQGYKFAGFVLEAAPIGQTAKVASGKR
jgi:hypothetical protein